MLNGDREVVMSTGASVVVMADAYPKSRANNPMATLLYSDLHAQLALPRGRTRPRRPGWGGATARGVRTGRLQPLPQSRRDPAQPHPRGAPLNSHR
jgi:hypothetical protein